MNVCLLWVLLGRGLCDELITHPEEWQWQCYSTNKSTVGVCESDTLFGGRFSVIGCYLYGVTVICTHTFDIVDFPEEDINDVPAPRTHGTRKNCSVCSKTLVKHSWKKLWNWVLVATQSAWVYGHSPAEIVGSYPTGGMDVCCGCCVFLGRGLCDALITRPEESYRLWCVVVCDLETARMRRPWPPLAHKITGKNKK